MATSIRESDAHPIVKLLIGEPTVLAIIGLNAVILFIDHFPNIHTSTKGVLQWVDYGCMVYFVIEAVWKMAILGAQNYWRNGWNRFDLLIVLVGIPLLLNPPFHGASIGAFGIAPLLRMGRFIRFIRIMRFVPNVGHIAMGVMRALRASVGVFLVLLVLNLILGLGATVLFGALPEAEQYFGNPLTSLYTLFKVFTLEGWYEVPDTLAQTGLDSFWVVSIRAYFILAVLVGGILGLSLANAVFVDEMVTDNNDELEKMVVDLRSELQSFREEMQQLLTEREDGG